MAKPADRDPTDQRLLWLNLAGFGAAALLLGLFVWRYGTDLLAFFAFLNDGAAWPGH